ncbi:MAG: OmpH family outer membrane protein [Candidatus Eremiobacteraeota bacterium]|nr:OmpH family outer membrane protein [Candidatus Eremiobacteraeota bacterium]
MIRRPSALAVVFVVMALVCAPLALAADLSDIGFIDQAAIGSLPRFIAANRDLAAYKATLDKQFQARMRATRSQSDQQKIIVEFQQKMAQRQRAVLAPLFMRAQTAIASVSSSRNLSVVVDRRIVIYGGQDITKSVTDLMQSPGAVAPPVNTPPPSEIGYVDQTQIDALPNFKSASDEFNKFADSQKLAAQQKLARAKTPADRQQILKDYQAAVNGKQDELLKPLVDRTKQAIGNVASKRNLILVIDRGDLIYGGTDITSDVQNALK